MTIVFQGHVKRLEAAHDNQIRVHLAPEASVCEHGIVVYLPVREITSWLPGRRVSFTIYALLEPLN